MENTQLLWGLNTLLLVILGFFIRLWISKLSADFNKLEAKLDTKIDINLCIERMSRARDDHQECTADNTKNHDEIFCRLRKVESG